jgi:hypothetical protein
MRFCKITALLVAAGGVFGGAVAVALRPHPAPPPPALHALAAPAQAPAGVQQAVVVVAPTSPPSSGVIDAAVYGVKAVNTPAQNSAALQRINDGITGPTLVRLPAGTLKFADPVFFDRVKTRVEGAGTDLTVLQPPTPFDIQPVLVFGLRQTEANGQKILRAHRPDAYGKLDATLAPSAGAWYGFASNGNAAAMSVASPAQCGPRSTSGGHGRWGDLTGITFSAAVRWVGGVNQTSEHMLLGLGSILTPGPVNVVVGGDHQLLCEFKLDTDGVDYSSPVRAFRGPLPNDDLVHDVRVWVDFATGTYGMAVDGTSVATTTPGMPSLTGRRFAKNRGQYPFFIGPAGGDPNRLAVYQDATPRVEIYAFSVANAARKTEPATDRLRYGVQSDVVVCLDGTKGTPSRSLPLKYGASTGYNTGTAFLLNTRGNLGGVLDQSVANLTVNYGSPGIAVGPVLDFKMEDVAAENGFQGLGSAPVMAAYTVTGDRCRFGGWDTGINLSWVIAEFRSVQVQRGGSSYARFTACNVLWHGGMGRFMDSDVEVGIDIIRGLYGGTYSLEQIAFDNEGVDFGDAAIRADVDEFGSYLFLRNIYAAKLGSGATMLRLLGPARNDIASHPVKGYLDAALMQCLDRNALSAAEVAGTWEGRYDTRGLGVRTLHGAVSGIDVD